MKLSKIYEKNHQYPVQMGFSGLEGGLFTQYRGFAEVLQKQLPESWKFPFIPVNSESLFSLHIIFKKTNGANVFNIYVYKCTLFL